MQNESRKIISGANGGELEWIFNESVEDLAKSAAAAVIEELSKIERPTLALSGGRIAPAFYHALRTVSELSAPTLQQTHYFWADERCVPPDSEESNYLCAKEHLLDPLSISSDQVHRIQGELGPQAAAAKAREDLNQVFGTGLNPVDSSQAPSLDLVILGMGEDGHVASLFPKHLDGAVDQAVSTFYGIEDSPKPPPQRVTLSWPMLIAAARVWTLIPGQAKMPAVKQALETVDNPFGKLVALRASSSVRVYSDFHLSK